MRPTSRLRKPQRMYARWRVVARACPLVASPIAERVICEVRAALARLLATNPGSLPEAAQGRITSMAQALALQGRMSEHAYVFTKDRTSWCPQSMRAGDMERGGGQGRGE
ncbi:unnamed protein product [Prorocentrum cordatum]|uniref:Uncharacterized protein n=1 Tax=Prorocentrum cordatum TaxID=2364126 RepID=A0ABN9XQY7_9DINO|nr:unnamed protein product [Polarella glacialis]